LESFPFLTAQVIVVHEAEIRISTSCAK